MPRFPISIHFYFDPEWSDLTDVIEMLGHEPKVADA